MPKPVQCSGAQQFVGEGITPLPEVEIAGDDRGRVLVSLVNQIMEVFIMGRAHGFESKIVNDD